ncbi:MAG: sulfotransferase family protein, partial [Gammaproteobacteria bacterium]|nr:sulfotransferase family protein [Gammaproteobacteria bacterium]
MISHKLKIIFIHVPRTAGTSIEMALIGKDWWDVDPDTKHIDWVKAKEVYAEYWDKYLKFSVVRNPWDWLASLYSSHRRRGDKSWSE